VGGKLVGPHALGDHPINRVLTTEDEKSRCAEFTAVLTFTIKSEPMASASEVVRQLQELEWIRFSPMVHYSKQYFLSFHTAAACRQFVVRMACRESCGFKIGGMYGHLHKVPSKEHPIFQLYGH
jgi:hypothetical protein